MRTRARASASRVRAECGRVRAGSTWSRWQRAPTARRAGRCVVEVDSVLSVGPAAVDLRDSADGANPSVPPSADARLIGDAIVHGASTVVCRAAGRSSSHRFGHTGKRKPGPPTLRDVVPHVERCMRDPLGLQARNARVIMARCVATGALAMAQVRIATAEAGNSPGRTLGRAASSTSGTSLARRSIRPRTRVGGAHLHP